MEVDGVILGEGEDEFSECGGGCIGVGEVFWIVERVEIEEEKFVIIFVIIFVGECGEGGVADLEYDFFIVDGGRVEGCVEVGCGVS